MNYWHFCRGKTDKASRKEAEFNYILLWLFKHSKLLIENANYKPVKMLSNYHWARQWFSMKGHGNCRTFKTKSNNAETFNIFSNISGLSWTRHSGMLRLYDSVFTRCRLFKHKSLQCASGGGKDQVFCWQNVVKHFPESSAKWRGSLFSLGLSRNIVLVGPWLVFSWYSLHHRSYWWCGNQFVVRVNWNVTPTSLPVKCSAQPVTANP